MGSWRKTLVWQFIKVSYFWIKFWKKLAKYVWNKLCSFLDVDEDSGSDESVERNLSDPPTILSKVGRGVHVGSAMFRLWSKKVSKRKNVSFNTFEFRCIIDKKTQME
jgi:hypothetical protein